MNSVVVSFNTIMVQMTEISPKKMTKISQWTKTSFQAYNCISLKIKHGLHDLTPNNAMECISPWYVWLLQVWYDTFFWNLQSVRNIQWKTAKLPNCLNFVVLVHVHRQYTLQQNSLNQYLKKMLDVFCLADTYSSYSFTLQFLFWVKHSPFTCSFKKKMQNKLMTISKTHLLKDMPHENSCKCFLNGNTMDMINLYSQSCNWDEIKKLIKQNPEHFFVSTAKK